MKLRYIAACLNHYHTVIPPLSSLLVLNRQHIFTAIIKKKIQLARHMSHNQDIITYQSNESKVLFFIHKELCSFTIRLEQLSNLIFCYIICQVTNIQATSASELLITCILRWKIMCWCRKACQSLI